MNQKTKKLYSPSEAVQYLNEKLHPAPPLDLARLGRLRREGRIAGEKMGGRNTVYSLKTLDKVTLPDLEDKRKTDTKKA